MALTYTEIKTALDEIAERATQNRKRVEQAKSLLAVAQSDLSAMQTAYASVVTGVNGGAASNPANIAWQTAKSEKDELVADFQDLRAVVDALVAAVNS